MTQPYPTVLRRVFPVSTPRFAATVIPAVLVPVGGGAGRADMAGMPGCSMLGAYKPQDLTGLDLDQLLNLDGLPIGVTGTHTHLSHEIMLGARLMSVHMGGNRDGNHNVSVDDVLKNYPVAHTRMNITMVMPTLCTPPATAHPSWQCCPTRTWGWTTSTGRAFITLPTPPGWATCL